MKLDLADSTQTVSPRWVLVFALVLFTWNLWGYDLWAPDEPYFGEGAREMVVDGEWLVPHVNGEVTTDKPPLFFWLIALFSLPFGFVSSLTARLPSVLAALVALGLTMRLGRRLTGPKTAVLAGALLATTHMFWDKARTAQIDSLLCCLILVAVSAFEAFRAGDWSGRKAGLVFWSAAAFAVLAKGPVGLLLPLGIAFSTLVADRRLPSWRRFAPVIGPLAFLSITGMWVVATALWATDYSVWAALREHFVDRAVHGMHHAQPVWYYFTVLPYALFPWSFLLPGALWLAWRRRRHEGDRFLIIWGLFVVLFFTVSTEKRDLYILPALPAFALLSSRLVAVVVGWWSEARTAASTLPGQRWITVPQGIIGALMSLAAVAAVIIAPDHGRELIVPAAVLAIVLGLGGLGVLIMAIRGRSWRSVQWTGATMATALLVAVSLLFPKLEPIKSGRQLAILVKDESAETRATGQPVLGLDLGNLPRQINFYSDGVYLELLSGPDELLSRLTAPGTVHLLTNKASLPALPLALEERKRVLHETHLSRRDVVFLRFDPL